MKQWRVIVELSAQEDIAEACAWLAERDPEAAKRWFDQLYETLASLETFPERCLLAPERHRLGMEIREIFHGRRFFRYRVLFTVREETVHIFHVRHGARLALGEPESPEDEP